ncbi:MAG TPA: rod shape-determining protein MreC [Xanthomonadaceae bacterium]|nr:rod shape-determining protein MreC [Xanthomonadaceae bacterium]
MAVSGSASTSLFAEGGAGTLRLIAYLAASLFLMIADHRGGHLDRIRGWGSTASEPLYWLAAVPGRVGRTLVEDFGSRRQLVEHNSVISQELLLANARLHRLEAVQRENQRLRELLGAAQAPNLSVQLATPKDIDLDPFRHRLLLDVGSRDGVSEGLAIIDAGGVIGQVIEVSLVNSTAMLISDPNHAVPVQGIRSGVRAIAYGTGATDRLRLPNIPPSADLRVGDELVTSGLGGIFPAGFRVGRIEAIDPDETGLFLVAEVVPAAALDRSGQVLLLRNQPPPQAAEAGAPAPEPTQ